MSLYYMSMLVSETETYPILSSSEEPVQQSREFFCLHTEAEAGNGLLK